MKLNKELGMKSYGHLEDVNFVDVLQIAVTSSNMKISYVWIELVFAGDWDIHMNMSLCLKIMLLVLADWYRWAMFGTLTWYFITLIWWLRHVFGL